jgi:peptidyl-prolyl cis-trans isomerase SDCCAG10
MSTIYHTEPATSGKVLLKTSYGDIDVELWSKEAPLACKNFVQHAIDGYYDNNVFHRVIKGLMAQTGDPTGTGEGGDSIYGKPFKDEIHQRIKFNHRGQVACANEQKPHSNHSQFFMTFTSCEWLDRKHTIFGKVTGNTIFNLLKMEQCDVNSSDRPVEDVVLYSIEILNNPFPDLVPSVGSKTALAHDTTKVCSSKPARKAVKDTALVSFGDDEEEGSMSWQPKQKKRKITAITSAREDFSPNRVDPAKSTTECETITDSDVPNNMAESSVRLLKLKEKLAASQLALAEKKHGSKSSVHVKKSGHVSKNSSLIEQQRAQLEKRHSSHSKGASSHLFKVAEKIIPRDGDTVQDAADDVGRRGEDTLARLDAFRSSIVGKAGWRVSNTRS